MCPFVSGFLHLACFFFKGHPRNSTTILFLLLLNSIPLHEYFMNNTAMSIYKYLFTNICFSLCFQLLGYIPSSGIAILHVAILFSWVTIILFSTAAAPKIYFLFYQISCRELNTTKLRKLITKNLPFDPSFNHSKIFSFTLHLF